MILWPNGFLGFVAVSLRYSHVWPEPPVFCPKSCSDLKRDDTYYRFQKRVTICILSVFLVYFSWFPPADLFSLNPRQSLCIDSFSKKPFWCFFLGGGRAFFFGFVNANTVFPVKSLSAHFRNSWQKKFISRVFVVFLSESTWILHLRIFTKKYMCKRYLWCIHCIFLLFTNPWSCPSLLTKSLCLHIFSLEMFFKLCPTMHVTFLLYKVWASFFYVSFLKCFEPIC